MSYKEEEAIYRLPWSKKLLKMHSNDDIQLVASKRHKETSLEHKTQ